MANRLNKRSLILAGGGLKVSFQAGVLQVWLDEAGLTFDHADGASGGCFNLAMYCQGMSGTQMADNWRNLDPFLPVDLNWEHYWKLTQAPSLFTYDRFRARVLPFWDIDWDRIHASDRLGTFNVFNFSKKQLEVITNKEMTEDHLIAAVSLPIWFPPVVINGQTYFDAAFVTNANVEEAIRRGADEIWAIWTVSTQDEWQEGFVAQYFQIIETTADAHFFNIWKRIERNNAAIAAGGTGEFGRHIQQRLLQAEVPIHYLLNLSRDRMAEAVNLGVVTARNWCRDHGVPLPDRPAPAVEIRTSKTRLRFTEEMKGYVASGPSEDYEAAYRHGRQAKNFLMFHLTIEIEDVDHFVSDPRHEARATGWVENAQFGGRLAVDKGSFNLFTHDRDPRSKTMLYRLFFYDNESNPLTLSAHKEILDQEHMDLWSDTTTLFTKIYRGHLSAEEEANADVLAVGILRIYLQDFLRQLTTFSTEGPSIHDRISALNRFGRFFLGKLWDVYGRQFIEYAPF